MKCFLFRAGAFDMAVPARYVARLVIADEAAAPVWREGARLCCSLSRFFRLPPPAFPHGIVLRMDGRAAPPGPHGTADEYALVTPPLDGLENIPGGALRPLPPLLASAKALSCVTALGFTGGMRLCLDPFELTRRIIARDAPP